MPLEKQANILIGDHARKDVAAGFTSWKFIEQSVKNGYLEDVDAYSIGQAAPVARAGVANRPKGTRNPFTPADDALLRAWVALPENRAAGTSGNRIFQDLEDQVSRTNSIRRVLLLTKS